MSRTAKSNENHLDFAEDKLEKLVFEISGVMRKRVYQRQFWRNNTTGNFVAMFGFYGKDKFHKVWIKGSSEHRIVSAAYIEAYHRHIHDLYKGISLMRVNREITNQGMVPVNSKGKPLDYDEDKRFHYLGDNEDSTFNMIISDPDTNDTHLVSKDSFEFC